MEIPVYAIYDSKAESYNSPFPLASDGLAVRAFEQAAKDPRTDLAKYPDDFTLYKIGTWNPANGELKSIIPPKFIANCKCKPSEETKE